METKMFQTILDPTEIFETQNFQSAFWVIV